jgi:hypothetical protein
VPTGDAALSLLLEAAAGLDGRGCMARNSVNVFNFQSSFSS